MASYAHLIPDERTSLLIDRVLALLAPKAGEKILDMGCSDGSISFILKGLGAHVIGVDTSPEKVALARSKGIEALLLDAENLFFDNEFDAVFSMGGLHFMRRPEMVLDGLFRALRKGGRFVAETRADGDKKGAAEAFLTVLERRGVYARYLLRNYYPTVDDYTKKLLKKGFRIKKLETVSFRTKLPASPDAYMARIAEKVFAPAIPPDACQEILAEATELFLPTLEKEGEDTCLIARESLLVHAEKP